jgi:hypothetical protein
MGFVLRPAETDMSFTSKVPLSIQIENLRQRARELSSSQVRGDLKELARKLLVLHQAGFCADVEIVQGMTKH